MELRKTNDQQARAKALEAKRLVLGGTRPQNETPSTVDSGQGPNALDRPAHADRIELSEAVRNHMASDLEGETLRANLVVELRSAYQDGSLLTRERIEKAASRLLGA